LCLNARQVVASLYEAGGHSRTLAHGGGGVLLRVDAARPLAFPKREPGLSSESPGSARESEAEASVTTHGVAPAMECPEQPNQTCDLVHHARSRKQHSLLEMPGSTRAALTSRVAVGLPVRSLAGSSSAATRRRVSP
jgi:hypothetical protein